MNRKEKAFYLLQMQNSRLCGSRKSPYSPPTEGFQISWGVGGGLSEIKAFKEMYEAWLEFPEGWGGDRKKSLSWFEVVTVTSQLSRYHVGWFYCTVCSFRENSFIAYSITKLKIEERIEETETKIIFLVPWVHV